MPSERVRVRVQGFSGAPVRLGHRLQGGVGHRGLFPYNDETCVEPDEDGSSRSSCRGRHGSGPDIGPSLTGGAPGPGFSLRVG